MKKLVLALTVVLVLSGIFAVAAFTSVEMDREVTATVRSDVNENVAVFFQPGPNYDGTTEGQESVLTVDGGKVTIELGNVFTGGFNQDAVFVVGGDGPASAVFGITNNSNVSSIVVSMDGDIETDGEIELRGNSVDDEGSAEIPAGLTRWFHFGFNTHGITPTDDTINGTLEIRPGS